MDLRNAFDSVVANALDRRILIALFEARAPPRVDDVHAAVDHPEADDFEASLDRLATLGLAHRARTVSARGSPSLDVLAITSAGVAIAQVVVGVLADGASLDKVMIGKGRPEEIPHYLIRP